MQGNAFKFLFGGTAAVMVDTIERNRDVARLNLDFEIMLFILSQNVDIGHNAKVGGYLVWNILRKTMDILQALDIATVVNTYIYSAALSIGKTANPFEILIAPQLFELYILRFGIHSMTIVGQN